jgi:hypothetical protein
LAPKLRGEVRKDIRKMEDEEKGSEVCGLKVNKIIVCINII